LAVSGSGRLVGSDWPRFVLPVRVSRFAFNLLKGGDSEVWRLFRIKKKFRESQGIIYGKRSGTTENIGKAARNLAATKPYQSAG
jgi:hypothetical protein